MTLLLNARSWCSQCDRRQPFRLILGALRCCECSTPLQDFPKPANPDKAPGPVEGSIYTCCGCSCHVCAGGHSGGKHTDECRGEFERAAGPAEGSKSRVTRV